MTSCNECYRCAHHYHIRENRIGCNNPDPRLAIPPAYVRDYLYPSCFDPEMKPRLCSNFEEFEDRTEDRNNEKK